MTTSPISIDTLHRTAKGLLDSGQASSLEDAMGSLQRLQLSIHVGAAALSSPTFQAALLTMVTCAHRCFLGGVYVTGEIEVPLAVPSDGCRTVTDAVRFWGGTIGSASTATVEVLLGSVDASSDMWSLRPTFEGWTGAIVTTPGALLANAQENVVTGVLIGGMAVAEAFQIVMGTNPRAGRREVGISLWDPAPSISWRDAAPGPVLRFLPSRLWLIGLGHLGQAYLWTLGFLPFTEPQKVDVALQDVDRLVIANQSTSPLTKVHHVGQHKTRMLSQWAESRGFTSRIIEHSFTSDFRVVDNEPRIALCGVDNTEARAALESAGFDFIVEAGLGKGWKDYLDIMVHTFPGPQQAADRWASRNQIPLDVPAVAAYEHLSQNGMDRCGLLQISSRSVGAAFVGCTAAALVVSELLRVLHGGVHHALIDMSLGDITCRRAVVSHPQRSPSIPWINGMK